jgi:LacI family transcriptional regulator
MSERVSIRDLAKAAGVSRTTVSLALRDSHNISAPVRKRIQDLAAQMNYRSHPMLASLMEQIRIKRKLRDEETIAFVTSDLSPDDWKTTGWMWEIWKGAAEEANRFGFRLERFSAGPGGKNSSSLAKVLYHRGIRGLLFGPMPWPHPIFSMPWENFVPVACTVSTGIKELPLVKSNHHRNIVTLFAKLKALGAHSIGAVISEEDDLRIERAWSGGGHSFTLDSADVKTNLLRLSHDDAFDEFAAWYRRVKPDVIVGIKTNVIQNFIQKLGLIPGIDIAYASLNVLPDEKVETAGIFQDPFYLGRKAIQYISKSIYDQSLGLPEHSEAIVIDGKFVDGKSLDPLRKQKSKARPSKLR